MKNTLLMQELRDMLRGEHYDDLRTYCHSNTPQVIAGFLEALDPGEIKEVFSIIDRETAAAIFHHFEDEVKDALQDIMSEQEFSELLFELPEEVQQELIEDLPDDERKTVESYIDLYEKVEEEEKRKIEEDARKGRQILIYDEDGEILENLTIYRSTPEGLKELPAVEDGCWINAVMPFPEEIDYLVEHFNIPRDFLASALDIDERARIEKDDNATLIITRMPIYDEANKSLMYATMAVGIILVNGVIITVSPRRNLVLEEFIEGEVRHFSTIDREQFIMQILLRATLLFLLYLKQMNNIAMVIQKHILEASQNRQLSKMLSLEKSLVYFVTSLKSNEFMMTRLKRMGLIREDDLMDDLWEDLEIEHKQAVEMAQIYSHVISNMMGAFGSIISNNLNLVMRILTSFTIVLTIPVIFASFYGMNVPNFLEDNRFAFGGIFVLSLAVSGIVIYFFRKRHWL
ncbi:MAG TPA: CorA family divalent cation transporter [bacterium]|nr:CorA family divalent cation transporter [bacterium]